MPIVIVSAPLNEFQCARLPRYLAFGQKKVLESPQQVKATTKWLDTAHSAQDVRTAMRERALRVRQTLASQPMLPGPSLPRAPKAADSEKSRESGQPTRAISLARIRSALLELVGSNAGNSADRLLSPLLKPSTRETNSIRAIIVTSLVLDSTIGEWLGDRIELAKEPWESTKKRVGRLDGLRDLHSSAYHLLQAVCHSMGWTKAEHPYVAPPEEEERPARDAAAQGTGPAMTETDALLALAEANVWPLDRLPAGVDVDILRCLDEAGLIELRYIVMQNMSKFPGDTTPPAPQRSPWMSPIKQPDLAGRWDTVMKRTVRDVWNTPWEIRLSERGRVHVTRQLREKANSPPKSQDPPQPPPAAVTTKMQRLVRIAEAATAINVRSDTLLKKLRSRKYTIEGVRGSYQADFDQLMVVVPGKKRSTLKKWADEHYPVD